MHDWDDERRPSTGVAPLTSWTVEIIWTLAQAQQRGLAQRLLNTRPESWINRLPRSLAPPLHAIGERSCALRRIWVPDWPSAVSY
jgi:hypothetical protein